MTDEELVVAFESASLPAEQFTHAAHVRVAWCYLRLAPLPEALLRFSSALRRFATAHGAAGKYHETITVAYMLIIADRCTRGRAATWAEFAEENPDLFARPSVLEGCYSPEVLMSERARASFVLPDAWRG
ncbi:MAG TPA: hypothetical protein VF147_13170 [Vicinamibacterales bacterium]